MNGGLVEEISCPSYSQIICYWTNLWKLSLHALVQSYAKNKMPVAKSTYFHPVKQKISNIQVLNFSWLSNTSLIYALDATRKQVCSVMPGIAPSQIQGSAKGLACSATYSDKRTLLKGFTAASSRLSLWPPRKIYIKGADGCVIKPTTRSYLLPFKVLLNETGISKSHLFTVSYVTPLKWSSLATNLNPIDYLVLYHSIHPS